MNNASLKIAAKQVIAWRQYICLACGLIYDEEKGDPDSGIAPGTRFEDIPDDWSCPLCGVSKTDFELFVAQDISKLACSNTSLVADNGNRKSVVIVGAGSAGWQVAKAIRGLDQATPITMVTSCNGDIYDKPMLSVAIAKGVSPRELVKASGNAEAAKLGIKLITSTHAISIDKASSSLRTTRGVLKYSHLILAHGATPRTSPNLPDNLCWRINDLQTYIGFRNQLDTLRPKSSILIAGAGLVGSELANDLALAGHTIYLTDLNNAPIGNLLDDESSKRLLDAWKSLPIIFLGGVSVVNVTAHSQSKNVELSNGQKVRVDHVIAATGLQTPSRLARSADMEWQDGICVEPSSLKTNVENIHALGDCVSIDGKAIRYIEPIHRQAQVIAAKIADYQPVTYLHTKPVIRIKTTSLYLTA